MGFFNQATLNKILKSQTVFSLSMAICSIGLGSAVGLIAGTFELSFKTISLFWQNYQIDFLPLPPWVIYAIAPFLALPLLYVILRFIPEQRPHNPADLIAAIHINRGAISLRSSLLTVLGAVISLSFGFSVGYYAPTLQLGASAGALLNRAGNKLQRFKKQQAQPSFIHVAAGGAAAIAAIFHSPIAAVVFVHEVLLRFFSVRAFAAITLSAISAYLVSSHFFHKAIFFSVPSHYASDLKTYVFAAVFAVIAALFGTLLIKSIMLIQAQSNRFQLGLFSQLVIATVIIASLVGFFPEIAGSNSLMMQQVLNAKPFGFAFLALILLVKFIATVSALGLRVAGGIFGPTIFLGATLGSLCAEVGVLIFPELAFSRDVLVITTMAAMITSVIGAPISMILIVIEITGNFHLISVVMLSVVVANLVDYVLMNSSSFFDILLKTRGMDFDSGRDKVFAEHKGIVELITEEYLTFTPNQKAQECEQLLLQHKQEMAFVVDDNHNLLGQVRLLEIERICKENPEAIIEEVQEQPLEILYRNTSIWQAMKQMYNANNRELAVIDGENNPKLLGVVYPKVLMASYFSYLEALRSSENLTK